MGTRTKNGVWCIDGLSQSRVVLLFEMILVTTEFDDHL